MTLVSVDLGMTEERIQELEQPVTDEQFNWLEERGLLDNGKTYEENRNEWEARPKVTVEGHGRGVVIGPAPRLNSSDFYGVMLVKFDSGETIKIHRDWITEVKK